MDTPLPRGRRQRRRARADRGLPPESDLVALATTYLERQRKLWPKVVEAGLLPEPSESVIGTMMADFKHRHRTGKVDLEQVQPYARVVSKLAGNYDRYSCDNSNPTSNLDQMVRALDKAHSENRFIPWAYVFCDYSVNGLDASRQGYTSYKVVLADSKQLIETTYIDDFTRASRDEIEWWRLAAMSKRCRKRLIGASDGFDLSNPNPFSRQTSSSFEQVSFSLSYVQLLYVQMIFRTLSNAAPASVTASPYFPCRYSSNAFRSSPFAVANRGSANTCRQGFTVSACSSFSSFRTAFGN